MLDFSFFLLIFFLIQSVFKFHVVYFFMVFKLFAQSGKKNRKNALSNFCSRCWSFTRVRNAYMTIWTYFQYLRTIVAVIFVFSVREIKYTYSWSLSGKCLEAFSRGKAWFLALFSVCFVFSFNNSVFRSYLKLHALNVHFYYTPVFRQDVLWYGDVSPGLRPVSVHPSGLRPPVFRTFLLHALTYWAEILHMTFF